MRQQTAGFTLLEALLSVVIISMLAGISLPVYESFVRRNDLGLTAQNITFMLRRAQTYSRAVSSDSTWGVRVQAPTVTLFQGATYATRVPAFDETLSIPSSITPSGLSEINFSKMNATPSTTGTITLFSTTNDSKTITINSKGMVNY